MTLDVFWIISCRNFCKINYDTLPKIIAKYFVIISFARNKSDKNARETSFQQKKFRASICARNAICIMQMHTVCQRASFKNTSFSL